MRKRTNSAFGFEVGNRYAFGNTNVGGQLWPAIFGAPNNWGVDSAWQVEEGLGDRPVQSRRTARTRRVGGRLLRSRQHADNRHRGQCVPGPEICVSIWQCAEHQLLRRGRRAHPPFHADAESAVGDSVWQRQLPADASAKPQYNYGIGNFGLIILKKNSTRPDQTPAEHHQLHRGAVREPGVPERPVRGEGPGLPVRRERQSGAHAAGRPEHDFVAGRRGRSAAGPVRSTAQGLRVRR